jgi:hypothetical protein
VDVGAAGQKDLDDIRMLLRHGPHQRGLSTRSARVYVCTLVDQSRDDVRVAGAGGDHQRRLAAEEREIRIRPGLQKPSDHGRAAVQARIPERRRAEIVGRVHIGARANQQIRTVQRVSVARPVQRGRSIRRRRLDVDTLLEERAQRIGVVVSGGVDQRRPIRRVRRSGEEKTNHEGHEGHEET